MTSILSMEIIECKHPPSKETQYVDIDTDWDSKSKADEKSLWGPIKISVENTLDNQKIVGTQVQKQLDSSKEEEEEEDRDFKFETEVQHQILDEGQPILQTWQLEGVWIQGINYTSRDLEIELRYDYAKVIQEDELEGERND